MGEIFGTDGVRGCANEKISCELAIKMGRATVLCLGEKVKKVLISKDTRISSGMIESAVAAGVCSAGADVILIDIAPTPAAAFLMNKLNTEAAIVISASHNSFEFNGIKIFGPSGSKLSGDAEKKIEEYIGGNTKFKLPQNEKIGKITNEKEACSAYVEHLKNKINGGEKIRVAFDLANGAASFCTKRVFEGTFLECKFLFDSPNGININHGCGSTNIDFLSNYVKNNNFDLGIAYDGDADRCLAVDENGELLNGDYIMAACALEMAKNGKLASNTVVGTPMANLGMVRFLKENDIKFIETKIGDHYILEEMLTNGYNFGGEQSGHIIFRDILPTGDGILTSVMFINYLVKNNKKTSDVRKMFRKYPQFLKNIKKSENFFEKNGKILEECKTKLGENGRFLVRESGTEPLVRISVQAETYETLREIENLLKDIK
jgi:phosphoglucosamine mutase